MSARENILQKIKQALEKPVPVPFDRTIESEKVFVQGAEDDAVLFAQEFTKLQGRFAYCINESELCNHLAALFAEKGFINIYCSDEKLRPLLLQAGIKPYHNLESCDCSVTGCEYLVARTGSVVLSAKQTDGRTESVYAPIHICIAYNHQLVFDIEDALVFLKEKYKNNLPSFISFATGPSRTADIEKTLVTGVHGPKEVFCFLMEEV